MAEQVYIIGVGMTPFGRWPDKGVKDLAAEAAAEALADAGLERDVIQAAWFSNSTWGYFCGQGCIRGQVVLASMGWGGLAVTNVENACAGGSTALHGAWLGVASGAYDCALALGAEKMYQPDKHLIFGAFDGCLDVERREETLAAWAGVADQVGLTLPPEGLDAAQGRSVFMDVYAAMSHWHMGRFGSTERQLAAISAKNHAHGALNPKAQIKQAMTVDEILAGRLIAWPLTLPMCAPIGDGAAAAVVCSADFLRRTGAKDPIRIRASVLASGRERGLDGEGVTARAARQAYEKAGVGPEDIDTAEVHDATAYGELVQVEAVGFCPPGEGGRLAESGATSLGGRLPVNPSGGLECRGHPIGASGLAQIYELVTQLRGRAGARQVAGARLALAENGGGNIGFEEAAATIHILEKA